MKKIILLILCLFVCSISINAKTIFDYKNKDNTSPIKKYKITSTETTSCGNLYGHPLKCNFYIEGKVVDKNNKPIPNKTIILLYIIHPSPLDICTYNITGTVLNGKIRDIESPRFKHGKEWYEDFYEKYKHLFQEEYKLQTDNNGIFRTKVTIEHEIWTNSSKKMNSEQYRDFIEKSCEFHFIFDKHKTDLDLVKEMLYKGVAWTIQQRPAKIIYKYPFDTVIKISPYDKNDNAQITEIEKSKNNVIVLNTDEITLSPKYFIEKVNKEKEKQNIIDEATRMLREEKIYDDINNLIIEVDGNIKENWKEIIELKIKEVNNERKQKEIEEQNKEQQRQKEIEKFKHDPDLHTVQSQIGRCPKCYRFTLGISLLMRTGDPYHIWLMMFCPECSYYKDEFRGF